MKIPNPFEIIYELNAKYNKLIAIIAIISIIMILPFTLDGFQNTESSQEEFLSSGSEGKHVSDLLKEKFPSRPEASMTLIFHSKGDLTLNNGEIADFSLSLQDDLENNAILKPFGVETISLKSIERDARQEYYSSMNDINESIQESFKTSYINDTYHNVASLEEFVNETIDLANSIESFNLLTSMYMKYYFDIMRVVFYEYNQTYAFDPPMFLNATDYSILDAQLVDTLGDIDYGNASMIQAIANQTTPFVIFNIIGLDAFTSGLASNFLNGTLEAVYSSTGSPSPYTQSGLYYIYHVINDNWMSSLATATSGGLNPFSNILVGSAVKYNVNPGNITEMMTSQGALLSSLYQVNNIVLENSFLNLTKTSLSGNDILGGLDSLFSGLTGGSSGLPSFPPMDNGILEAITYNITNFAISNSGQTDNSSIELSDSLVMEVANVAVSERETKDQNVIGNFTLNHALVLLGNSGSDGGFVDFGGELNTDINQTKIMESFNLTNFITQSYIAGKTGKLDELKDDIALQSASEILTGIMNEVPEPTISDFPDSITHAFISDDNKTMLLIVNYHTEPKNDDLAEQVHEVRDIVTEHLDNSALKNEIDIYVSGDLPINYDMDHSMENDISKIDIVTVVLVLVLLTIVFRSFITPLIPLLSIFMALLMAVGVLSIISTIQDISIPSLMLAVLSVIMFGAGVDYCLFVVARYREERVNGKPKRRAVKESVLHAGESVSSSGTTVMIGFGALILSSFGLLNQMGRGPLIGIAFSLMAALTLIPIALFLFGDKLFWPRNFEKEYKENKENNKSNNITTSANGTVYQSNGSGGSALFRKLATFTVHNPWKVIIFFLIATAPFLFLTMQITPSYDNTDLLPTNVESVDGLVVLSENFPPGELFPLIVVFEFNHSFNSDNNFFDLEAIQLVESFAETLETRFLASSDDLPIFDEIRTFSRPNGELVNYINPDILNDPLFGQTMLNYVNTETGNDTIILYGFTRVDPIGEDALNSVKQVKTYRDTLVDNASYNGVKIEIGGSPSLFSEIQVTIDNETPFLAAFVLVGVYFVLFFLLGSFWTPIRLELTILLSLVVTLGATQFLFVETLGRGIPWIMPIMLFVLIFGLGIDYDIFIVTRIREEIAHKGLSDEEAIINAIENTGSVISAAGIIMASALGSLMLASSNILQIMGFAFFISILLDATVVRVFLVPALMVVMGKKYNWWNPIKSLERVPSPHERDEIKQYYFEHLTDEKKRVTDDEVDRRLEHLKTEYQEMYYFKRKFITHTRRWRKYTNSDIKQVKEEYHHITNLINRLENEYKNENPQMFYTLEGDFNRNLGMIKYLRNLLGLFNLE